MHKDIVEALETGGFKQVHREAVKVGDTVVGHSHDYSERIFGGEVVNVSDRAIYVNSDPGREPFAIRLGYVWRKPHTYKPGTYAKVEYGDVVTTGVLLHGEKCALTAMTMIVPLSDVKVLETIWEPGEGDADLVRGSVAPSVNALKARPGWCVIDADGDWWRWEGGNLLLREDGDTGFSPWWMTEEAADKYISHKDARWEFMAKGE